MSFILFLATSLLQAQVSFEEKQLATLPERAITPQVEFSPNGEKVAYILQTQNGESLYIGDQQIKSYGGIRGLLFSPDSSELVYIARQDQYWHAHRKGKVGEGFDVIGTPGDSIALERPLVFSPDGRHLAYKAGKGESWFTVIDGRKSLAYDDVSQVVFSPDSSRSAYGARVGNTWKVVVDGKGGAEFDSLTSTSRSSHAAHPVFSPDGSRFAYSAKRKKRSVVVEDGREIEECAAVMGPGYSPDGRLTYVAMEKEHSIVVIGKHRSEPYESAWFPSFSRDGRNYVYLAKRRGREFVVNNGKRGPDYEEIILFPKISGDGRTIAYQVRDGEKEYVVIGDRQTKRMDDIRYLTMARTGQVLYEGRIGDRRRLYLDTQAVGDVGGGSGPMAEYSISGDMDVLAGDTPLVSMTGRKGHVVVLGSSVSKPIDIVGRLIVSPDRRSVAFSARQQGQLWWRVMAVRE